jgi:acyl-CoA synthetase (AMP-forming)/AMP-acid ligase II
MDGLKHTHQAVGAEILTGMLGLTLGFAPMWLALGTHAAFRIRQPLVQTVTTNVPGPRRSLYALGRPLTALYPWITGRVDDVINVSGHRLSTAEIESALVSHPAVAEAAVIASADDLTGQAVVACVRHPGIRTAMPGRMTRSEWTAPRLASAMRWLTADM